MEAVLDWMDGCIKIRVAIRAQSPWVPSFTFSPHCPSNVGGQSDPAAEDLVIMSVSNLMAMDPHLPHYKIKELD